MTGMTKTHQSPTYTFKGKNKEEHMLTHRESARNKVYGLRVVPTDRTVIRHADGSKGHVMSDGDFYTMEKT